MVMEKEDESKLLPLGVTHAMLQQPLQPDFSLRNRKFLKMLFSYIDMASIMGTRVSSALLQLPLPTHESFCPVQPQRLVSTDKLKLC